MIYHEESFLQGVAVGRQMKGWGVTKKAEGDTSPARLQSKTARENGVIMPDAGYDGLSRVNVDVNPPLQAKNVQENTTVMPDEGYYGLSRVVVNVTPPPPTLQSKRVTVNGLVTPDAGYDGLSQVDVDVELTSLQAKNVTPGTTEQDVYPDAGYDGLSHVVVAGDADLVPEKIKAGESIFGVVGTYTGGGGVPLLTRAAWNALTTPQKRAYGLVAIQDTDSGLDRGELYYGADYMDIGNYIPYSQQAGIICEAYVANFESSLSSYWGAGTKPITIQAGLAPSVDSGENAVYLPIRNKDAYAYVDLGATRAPYTLYIVAKLISPSIYTRIVCGLAGRNSGQGMLLYGSSINVSSWANDTNTGVSSSSAYFAAALQYDPTQATPGRGMVGSNGTYIGKTPGNSGQYITLGRSDITPGGQNSEPANMFLKYFAVTTNFESEAVIRANLANLESVFIS